MRLRTPIGALMVGALISLAGTLIAAILVAFLVVAAPGLGGTPAFFWTSIVVATLLQGSLGFVGAGVASRRLPGISGWRTVCIACAGPVAVSLLTQMGVASQGRPEWSLFVVCGTLAGAVAGSAVASRAARRAGADERSRADRKAA